MNKSITVALLIIVALLVFCSAGMAATKAKAKAKPKPVQKAPIPPKTPPHIVIGTTQLAGEFGQMNTTYTLGKTSPFNITLKSAEYSVEPIRIGSNMYTVNDKEKFLILHMTYHNPQPNECFIRWDSFGFTIVDPSDQNVDNLLELGAENDGSIVAMSFKPAQKKDVFGVMKVPAVGEMPKLIIKSSDELVIRYDLRGKVKGLPPLFADPADKTGATALPKAAAVADTTYSVDTFSFKFNKAEYATATKMGDTELSEGEKFFIINFTLKNINTANSFFRWDGFNSKIVDVDGVAIDCIDLFQASKDKSYANDMEPGQEVNLRYAFRVPADTTLKSYTVSASDGRVLEYDISAAK